MPALTSRDKATIFGVFSLLFWAAGAVLTTNLKSIPVFEILSIVFTISFALTAIKLTYYQEWHKLKQPLLVSIIGFLGIYGNDLLYIAAFKHAPPVQADLINYLWPVLVILFLGLLPDERFSPKHLIATFLGFLGVYIAITNGHGISDIRFEYWCGYLLAFTDAVVWTVYTLVARIYKDRPVEMVGLYCGVGAVMSIYLHFHLENTLLPSFTQSLTLFVMGITTQGLAYFFWDYSVKNGRVKFLTTFSYFMPVISVLLLIAFGKGEFTKPVFEAMVLITLAMFVANLNYDKVLAYLPSFKRYQSS